MALSRHFPKTSTPALAARLTLAGPSIDARTDGQRPPCPRCSSELVTRAPSTDPSEWVLELRGGDVPPACATALDEWLCSSCGLRWPRGSFDRGAEAADRETTGTDEEGNSGDPSELPSHVGASEAEAFLEEVEDLPDVSDLRAEGSEPARFAAAAMRRARTERGLSLSAAATKTRIWDRYLAALEADAPVEEFPSPAYARFFLGTYAEFLGLDHAEIVREFDRRHRVQEEPAPISSTSWLRRGLLVAGALILVVAVVSALVVGFLDRRTGRGGSPLVSAPAADAPSRPASSSLGGPPVAPKGIHVQLVLDGPCWVLAVGDHTLLERSTLEPGKVTYRAHHLLHLELGNAPAAQLRVNGRPVSTNVPGGILRIEFRWKDGELQIQRL